MSTYNFQDTATEALEAKREHRKDLSRSAGDIISKLTRFKGVYDTIYALSSVDEKAALDAKFNEFKLDAKNALGL